MVKVGFTKNKCDHLLQNQVLKFLKPFSHLQGQTPKPFHGIYQRIPRSCKPGHIKGNSNDPAEGVWAHLKYEGGVHRVQRVPVTETQGRIHTSAAGVLVFPEVDEPEEVEISQNEIRVDVFRSSGPGGQSVNTTDSAVRITHIPTGIVVSMQNEKSQLQNREAAMRVLRARILAAQQEAIDAEQSAARKSQVRTVDRSERIRTYNFPENRIADHRTGYKSYNLDQVMDGALEPVVQSAIRTDEEARLAALGDK